MKGGHSNTLDVHSNDLLITGLAILCIAVLYFYRYAVIDLTKPLGMQASIFGACPKPG